MASNTPDLQQLAREALDDEKRGTPGPWRTYEQLVLGREGGDMDVCDCAMGDGVSADPVEHEAAVIDAAIIAAARTREPLLAQGYLDAVAQRSRYSMMPKALMAMTEERDAALARLAVVEGERHRDLMALARAEKDLMRLHAALMEIRALELRTPEEMSSDDLCHARKFGPRDRVEVIIDRALALATKEVDRG